MNETVAKITFTGVLAALAIHLEALAISVVLLISAMLLDYATGLMAASHRGQKVSSYKSIKGIIKKIGMILAVAAGLVLDCLIVYVREAFGFSFPWSFIIAAVIAVWLTANEIISLLENIQDIGVNIPVWLLPLVKNIKHKVESVAPQIEKGDNIHE